MARFVLRLLISGAVIFAVSRLSGGTLLQVESFGWAVVLAFVLGIVNAIIKPIVHLLTFPVTVLTLGLFSLLINAAMLALATMVVPGTSTNGFWATILAAIIISVVTSLSTRWLEREDSNVAPNAGRPSVTDTRLSTSRRRASQMDEPEAHRSGHGDPDARHHGEHEEAAAGEGESPSPTELVVITGLAGAGRSEAIHTFEDLGYFCIDNLPPALLGQLVELVALPGSRIGKVAVVCDMRTMSFFDTLLEELDRLEASGHPFRILYLEAAEKVLVNRFKETRRRHPLAQAGSIVDGIRREQEGLRRVRERADLIIDTSDLLPSSCARSSARSSSPRT